MNRNNRPDLKTSKPLHIGKTEMYNDKWKSTENPVSKLKIRWSSNSVWVRLPPSAPKLIIRADFKSAFYIYKNKQGIEK